MRNGFFVSYSSDETNSSDEEKTLSTSPFDDQGVAKKKDERRLQNLARSLFEEDLVQENSDDDTLNTDSIEMTVINNPPCYSK